jgi:hypothetical protein
MKSLKLALAVSLLPLVAAARTVKVDPAHYRCRSTTPPSACSR